MKVLFCAYDHSRYVGGPNAWLKRLLPELHNQGIVVEAAFITRTDPDKCPTVGWLRRHGIPCRATVSRTYTEHHVRWLIQQAADSRPDVFVANLVVPAFYAAGWIKEAGIPTVGVIHSDDLFYRGILDRFVFGPEQYRLSGLVCVSDYLMQKVLSGKPRDIVITKIPCSPPLPHETAQRPSGNLKVIYTGRLVEKSKRIYEVSRSLCEAAKAIPGIEAYIYGDGPCRVDVEKVLEDDGRGLPVYLKDALDSETVYRHLLQFHVLVLLSDYEGLPVSLMEAMACGVVPVCLRTSSGIPELIKNGVNGFIVEDRGESFLKALRNLAGNGDLWESCSANARRTIESGYTLSQSVSQWAELFGNLAPHRRTYNPVRLPGRLNLPAPHEALVPEDIRLPGPFLRMRLFLKNLFDLTKSGLKKILVRPKHTV